MEIKLIERAGKGLKIHLLVNKTKKIPPYKFEGKAGEFLPLLERRKVYMGIGKPTPQNLRDGAAQLIRNLQRFEVEEGQLLLPRIQREEQVIAFLEGLFLGEYRFDRYKTKKEEGGLKRLSIKTGRIEKVKKALEVARIRAEAVNFVRDIVNRVPDDFTPQVMAETAQQLADELGLEAKIFTEKELEEGGFNAIMAVGRASAHPPRLIHLIYRPKSTPPNKSLKKVAIVGKGLCYDSGGLSLKPSTSMLTMKMDKAGGAVALGVIKGVAQLQLPVELHVVVGAVENMIGGNAYKPDDVITAKNGTTIEVRNTDAEGRLVLADCLAYIQEEVPELDLLVDVATLTGACMVGLGEFTAGVMGHNRELKRQLIEEGEKCGEEFADLPFNKYLPKLLESRVADIANISSSRYGGALTAALFLDHFIEEKNKEKWVHLDIAGPAYNEKGWGPHPAGATGFGVSTLISLITTLSRQ
jgi:leucyl aminopeptidase